MKAYLLAGGNSTSTSPVAHPVAPHYLRAGPSLRPCPRCRRPHRSHQRPRHVRPLLVELQIS
jgi:hypothetical protein